MVIGGDSKEMGKSTPKNGTKMKIDGYVDHKKKWFVGWRNNNKNGYEKKKGITDN